jgi:hypothetical protein
MKPKLFFLFLIGVTLFSCKKDAMLSIENPLNSLRTDEVIVLTKTQVEQKLKLKEGMLPVFKTADNISIPSQVDDLDGDGSWDEVVIVIDFSARESRKIKLELISEAEYPEFEKRTNLRLGIKQTDGSYNEVDNSRALPCNDGFEIIA